MNPSSKHLGEQLLPSSPKRQNCVAHLRVITLLKDEEFDYTSDDDDRPVSKRVNGFDSPRSRWGDSPSPSVRRYRINSPKKSPTHVVHDLSQIVDSTRPNKRFSSNSNYTLSTKEFSEDSCRLKESDRVNVLSSRSRGRTNSHDTKGSLRQEFRHDFNNEHEDLGHTKDSARGSRVSSRSKEGSHRSSGNYTEHQEVSARRACMNCMDGNLGKRDQEDSDRIKSARSSKSSGRSHGRGGSRESKESRRSLRHELKYGDAEGECVNDSARLSHACTPRSFTGSNSIKSRRSSKNEANHEENLALYRPSVANIFSEDTRRSKKAAIESNGKDKHQLPDLERSISGHGRVEPSSDKKVQEKPSKFRLWKSKSAETVESSNLRKKSGDEVSKDKLPYLGTVVESSHNSQNLTPRRDKESKHNRIRVSHRARRGVFDSPGDSPDSARSSSRKHRERRQCLHSKDRDALPLLSPEKCSPSDNVTSSRRNRPRADSGLSADSPQRSHRNRPRADSGLSNDSPQRSHRNRPRADSGLSNDSSQRSHRNRPRADSGLSNDSPLRSHRSKSNSVRGSHRSSAVDCKEGFPREYASEQKETPRRDKTSHDKRKDEIRQFETKYAELMNEGDDTALSQVSIHAQLELLHLF